MLKLKKSKLGLIIASIFVCLAILAFASHIYSVNTNTGDSGESAVVLLPFIIPWALFIPRDIFYSEFWEWAAYPVFSLLVLLNSFLIYCIFGGLRGDAES